MAYRFTDYVRKRMQKRGVLEERVIETMDSPHKEYADKDFPNRMIRERRYGDRILKVVSEDESTDEVVVSVMWLDVTG